MKPKFRSAPLCVWISLLTFLPLAHGASPETAYSFPAGPIYPYAGLVQGTDGNFYGTTWNGGTYGANSGGYGTVFRLSTNGILTTLASFAAMVGVNPHGGLVQGSDGNFYGTTVSGGVGAYPPNGFSSTHGTVFMVSTNGVLTSLYSFTGGVDGDGPYAGLIQGSDGSFYGTTANRGGGGYGTVFSVTTNGILTTLASFANTNGANPYAELVQGSDGNLYGTTVNGGDNGYGTVFRVTTNGTLTTLSSFNGTNGANPYARLVQGSEGNFYGTSVGGGDNGYGTVFRLTTNGTLTTLASFTSTNGANPYGGLVQGTDGNFYGTTESGGAYSNPQVFSNPWMNGYGTVFMVTTNGTLTTLHSFGAVTYGPGSPFDGGSPFGGLVQGRDGELYGTTYLGGSCGFGTAFMIATNGTFSSLAAFALNPVGANPHGELVEGSDGSLYGTTVIVGTNGYRDDVLASSVTFGTVFKLTTNGVVTSMVSFGDTNGANPYGALIEGRDGNLYGTTLNGGKAGFGSVFMVTTNGVLTSLYSFTGGTNGAHPYGGLVQGRDGNFYGTTANPDFEQPWGDVIAGTVFAVTSNGSFATLASFYGTNGAFPYGGLIQGADGNFYGTTANGGTNWGNAGTVFRITTNGVLTMLYSFTGGPDGAYPQAPLIQGLNGDFYGTTVAGGNVWNGAGGPSLGTVFKVTTNGTLTTLYSFGTISGGAQGVPLDGANPYGALVHANDGSFYGTTYGKLDWLYITLSHGTVFKLATNGVLTSLYDFKNGNDGAFPYAGMVQGSDSALYGTTYMGGASADPYNNGYGTVFRFVLPPIIFHQPTNQTVDAGGEAAFSVGSTGFGPLTYQWRKNGGDIPGATESSFSLTNVSAATAGNYSVAVSNPGGDVESSNATLTVVCPMITLGPTTFPTVTVGTGFNQTIIGIGGAEPYTFGLTGGRLPPGLSLSRSGVLSGTPTNIGNYSFTVKATDLHFCTGTISYNLAVGISFVSSFVDSNGWFSARVLVPVGASVIILESTNVSQPLSSWTPITTNSAPTGFFDFTDKTNSSLTNNWPRRFYRARFSP